VVDAEKTALLISLMTVYLSHREEFSQEDSHLLLSVLELHLVLLAFNLFLFWLLAVKGIFFFWLSVQSSSEFILVGNRLTFLSYLLYIPYK